MVYEMGDVRAKCADCGRKVPVKHTVEREGRVICWLCAGIDPWEDHTSVLHGGTCVECERPAPVLTQEGYCESCVMEAMIQARAW